MAEPIQIDAPMTLRDQIEARGAHPQVRDRVFLMHDERRWTYREFRNESVRVSRFLHERLGHPSAEQAGHVAMLLENHLELLSLLGGCAYAGYTLFGLNTGIGGDDLAGVLNQSRARLLVVDQKFLPEIERVQDQLQHLTDKDIFVLAREPGPNAVRDWRQTLESELGPATDALVPPDVSVQPMDNLIVIYTSGTTGLPKGINNSHLKLCLIGVTVAQGLGLTPDDGGYANMPLFHSNALFVGLMPAFWAGARMGLRERFSAGRFLADLRLYGATYWNYVGEPVHYVLAALEREFGDDAERIVREVAHDPRIRLRVALGNGAAAPDIDKLMKYFGLEDVLELYGSTEAAISTFRRQGHPRGSVGEILDPAVKILDESGVECAPAELDAQGNLTNHEKAVGEICRVAADTGLFQGYFDNPTATASKYRDGVYHSGDLGHTLIRNGQRFLFFDGRTEDWIRKDGENFSALQVATALREHPHVAVAAAYGVPSPVSDELVMAAIKLRPGCAFDPAAFFTWCADSVAGGRMQSKWFPDFVRVVSEFTYTQTTKVRVKDLKREGFNRDRLPEERIFWRRRGDLAYRGFTLSDYHQLLKQFAASERTHLLGR